MSTDTSQFDGAAFVAAADAFDAKIITDALALAGANSMAEMRAVIATLPGFRYSGSMSDNSLYPAALGILSEYTRQIAAMYQREAERAVKAEARVAELEAEISRRDDDIQTGDVHA